MTLSQLNLSISSAILASTLLLTACGGSDKAETTEKTPTTTEQKADAGTTDSAVTPSDKKLSTKFVTIGTGGASGPYNIIGTALSEVYVKTYGVNSKTQTTGASVENVNLLSKGKIDMALAMSDVVTDAVAGENNFKAPVANIQQIAVLYPNVVQVIASKDAGIKSLNDLKGKRISVGAQGSGTEVNARALLKAFGMTYDDVKVDYLGFADSADAMKTGKIDAAFFNSGMPNSSIMELEQGHDIQIVAIDGEKLDALKKDKAYFQQYEIPANTYGNAEAIPTAAIMNALLVNSDLSEEDGYLLTKSLFENLEGLKNAHQAAAGINPKTANVGMVAPIHTGAKKYYDEANK